MRSIGSGTSSSTLGMTSGTTPNAAYLATATSTRSAGGIAGYGSPSSGMTSISAVRSLPLTTSVDVVPLSGWSSWFVITPSISTVVVPRNVMAITTRKIGMLEPPVSRKSVCSGERFEILSASSKPLCVSPEFDSTVTCVTASITSRGAGTGTPGPMSSWRRAGSGIRAWHPLRKRDAQPPADGKRQVARIHDAVCVGKPPPQLRSADVAVREHVAPVALDDARLVERREQLRARTEPAAQERRRLLRTSGIPRVDTHVRVPARRRERRRRDGARGEELLQRIGHQRPSTPSCESGTDAA